jgi:hypothetical protein
VVAEKAPESASPPPPAEEVAVPDEEETMKAAEEEAGGGTARPLETSPPPREPDVRAGPRASPHAVETTDDDGFPVLRLARGDMKLTIHLPDAENGFYRGTRFDWSGIVTRVEYGGHTLFGPWKKAHNPTNHDDVHGTAEEFGMDHPPGYAEAKAGETFLKIGVGVLEKGADKPYKFQGRYRIVRPGTWEVTHDGDWIEFRQELAGDRGWAYAYTKRIALAPDAPAFTISHALRNTGRKPFAMTHYCHNFTVIDDEPIGPGYVIRFPSEVKTTSLKTRGSAEVRGNEIVFTNPLKGTFWASLTEFGERNEFSVENRNAGLGVRVTGDRPPVKINIWGQKMAICPEPFVVIEVAPGGGTSWTTRYELYTLER